MRLTRFLLSGLVLAVGAATAYWFGFSPPTVGSATPSRGAAAEVVYATGVVEPRIWAKVAPLVRERIVELCNCEGEPVERGAVLARLDDREAQAALAELQARLRLALEELERLTALAGRNIASEQALSQASSEVAQLKALVAGQSARLETYVLKAPMQGVVLRQDGEVGEIAEPGSVLSWVGQPTPLLVVAEVNEEDIPRVEVGQRALLRADAFPERNLEAVVDSITPKGDPVTKTYRVRLALPEATPLLIGMTVEVNVVVRVKENALLLPASAVEGSSVYVVNGAGSAHRRDVEIGIRGTREIEVLSGIDEDDRVIAPFPNNLDDGTPVKLATD
ncbi:MAG TPA: efflux RND transporter periplasmic adaptor subunit [Geminicoccaceae bacterium]|nr:efflux RND transporter periplasmic adaptor subunit [Geminicoccaceae bacterium]